MADVMKSTNRRRIILILLAVIILYSAGYIICRLNKSIVHSASAVGGKCTGHDVTAGDYKMNNLPPVLAALYTPLRYAELAVWKLVKPDGSAC